MPHSLEICSVLLIMSNIDENMDGADEIDEGGQVLHFEGDFFGHYTEEDFEWPDDHGVVEGDKDADESSDEEVVFDGEIGWEPAVLNAPDVGAPVSGPSEMPREHIYEGYSQKIAGSENIYAPFESKLDFDIALWAKMRGTGSTAFTDLLAIDDVHDRLGLSYKSSRELNNIIDKKLPTGRPQFRRQEVVVAGEAFDVYFRDVLECVKALYEDPEFAPYLVFVPERHYADKDKTMRLYHDMHTGKWWWRTQKEIEKEKPGATIIPIILSSDKTQHIKNRASQRRTITNLFHACMGHILEPLKSAGEDGLHMRSGDGITRRGHPLLACYVGDYPEQILVSGAMTGECPKCNVPNGELGSKDALFKPRDLESILAALNIADEDPIGFAERCAELRIKPIQHPFWQGLPKSNIFHAITPDVLHQLYQGLVKHMIAWIKSAFGEAEIDARCRRLPPNHNIRIFNKGISSLARVSGAEHNQICRFLLGVIIDIPLPNNISSAKLVRTLRGLLDFLYLAQYPCHSAETLQLLDEALTRFHDNKDIFVTLGIRTQFNLPKLHSYRHYLHMIQEYGTTDNYNTEYTERLHIDLAKDAYRATNHKDEYSQMTLWLERQEKILRHASYVHWRLAGDPLPQSRLPPDMQYAREYKMTKHPSVKAATIDSLRDDYGASFFRAALARYIVLHTRPDATTRAQVEHAAGHVYIPFASLPIFHKVRYNAVDSAGHKDESVTIDSVHCQPARRDKRGNTVPGRFDTVLVNCGNGGEKSVEGYRVAQVRVIFSIPEKHHASLFPSHILIPKHLAYVEWFSPFTGTSERNHGMHKVSRSYENGEQLVSIISVKDIRRSVHLIPKFGRSAPRDWTSSNVLEFVDNF
ncbi:uncharacterized protein F5147DRAFT_761177 [Suillus discolor]|uniref:DUF6830 domain-containing protein n=1 Tax=Suillus discolor TaxID=1912936 RepID=A0A9P7JU84_9AGAM|nr:uncharacterized protein F5147DRAFT_761177 [Suillus discolor]KAG2108065.1 hypothetical protein F5147DRAFT_761177 [Suillus discolor]